jgi:hypothetical protein
MYFPFTPPLPKDRFEISDIKEIEEDAVVCASQAQRRHRRQY